MKKLILLVLTAAILFSAVVISTFAESDLVDWEDVANGLELNLYIGKAIAVSPTIDGAVDENEYSYSVYNSPADIYNYESGEIQSGVTEYFAHDSEYVYYAAVFKQHFDDRAFQWRFKPFNSFDIYKDDSDVSSFYGMAVSFQVRYTSQNGVTKTDYFGDSAPVVDFGCVRAPSAVDENSELYCVAEKTADDVKTYEIRLSKAYLAEICDSDKEDIRVIPYFAAFHSRAAVGHIYTNEDNLTIRNADDSAYLPVENEVGYRFIVLDEKSSSNLTIEATQKTTPSQTVAVAPSQTTSSSPTVTEIVITTVSSEKTEQTTSPVIKTEKTTEAFITPATTKPHEHEYGAWGKHNDTYHISFCSCGDIRYAEHIWDDGVILIEPTAEEKGIKIYTCSECGEQTIHMVAKRSNEVTTATESIITENNTKGGCRSHFGGNPTLIVTMVAFATLLVLKRRLNISR